MGNELVRTVTFMAGERGKCEDLYHCNETGRVYIRQDCDETHVRWLTASKWTGGYEADCHLKSGLLLRVVKKDGCLLFEERMVQDTGVTGTWARKEGPFSWEAINTLANIYAEQLNLQSDDEWEKWLMAEAKTAGFTGYRDNWLYAMNEYGKREKMARLDYLGKTAYVVVQEEKHKACGKKWRCYEIMNADLDICLAICGYKFEEELT